MSIIVVGGNTRNIGKTSVVAGIISATPQLRWTAIKITQFGHGVCSANGEPCDCETADHTIAISEEHDDASGTDSSRYLAAGANRAFWVRTRQGQLHEAMPRVRKMLADYENVIVESNSILRFLKPAIAVCVLDLSVEDFKPSAMRFLDRADGVAFSSAHAAATPAATQALKLTQSKPTFYIEPPTYMTPAFADFINAKLAQAGEMTTAHP